MSFQILRFVLFLVMIQRRVFTLGAYLCKLASGETTIDDIQSQRPSRITNFLDHTESGRPDLRAARVDAGDLLIVAEGLRD